MQETLHQYDMGNFYGELPDPRCSFSTSICPLLENHLIYEIFAIVKRQEKWMVWISFGVNVILTIFKLVALVMSGSLSVFASFLDSILDLLSGSILFITERVSSKENVYKYPIGPKRIPMFCFCEPLLITMFLFRSTSHGGLGGHRFLSCHVRRHWSGPPSLEDFAFVHLGVFVISFMIEYHRFSSKQWRNSSTPRV